MSYKPQFQTDDTGKWYSNGQAFATKAEAEAERSAHARMMVWTAVRDYRAIESTDPVNYEIIVDVERRIETEHDLQVNAFFDNKKGLTP